MRMLIVAALLAMFAFASGSAALAQENENQYLELLGIAQRHAESKKTSAVRAPERDPTIGSALEAFGLKKRFFEQDEAWTVRLLPASSPMGRKSEAPEDLLPGKTSPVLFDFSVTGFDEQGNARVLVRQRVRAEVPRVEAGVDHMVLTIAPGFEILSTEVHFTGARSPVVLARKLPGNASLGVTAYPVVLPNLARGAGEPVSGVPVRKRLPAELANLRPADLAGVYEFRERDIYAREIRTFWRDGDVWPLFVEAPNGRSILVEKRRGAAQ